jgi:hypothetical protein
VKFRKTLGDALKWLFICNLSFKIQPLYTFEVKVSSCVVHLPTRIVSVATVPPYALGKISKIRTVVSRKKALASNHCSLC